MAKTGFVQKMLTRALAATEAEGAQHPFDHVDLAVAAAALLPETRSTADVAAFAGISTDALQKRMLDPVRCRWMSMELEKGVDTRLGMVIASVFQKALVTGDPQRARFLLELYREKKPEKHLHLHAQLDLTQLSTEELVAFVKDRKRVLGIQEEAKSEAQREDPDRDGGGEQDQPADR